MAKNKMTTSLLLPQILQEQESGEEFYQVQKILDRRLTSKGPLYLIRWKDYPQPQDFTWQPIKNLEAVKEMVAEFNQHFSEKVKQKNELPQSSKNTREELQIQKKTNPIVIQPGSKDLSKNETIIENYSKFKLANMYKGMEIKLPTQPKGQQKRDLKTSVDQEYTKRNKLGESTTSRMQDIKGKSKLTIQYSKYKKRETWESQQLKFGQIYKHFIQAQSLYFNIALLNKDNQICDMVSLSLDQMTKEDKGKLINYLESYFKQILIKEQRGKLQQYAKFQTYWKSLS